MKKNRYGNIEDLLVALRAVTPKGEWTSTGTFPRVSTGPDMNHVMLGSEGKHLNLYSICKCSFDMFAFLISSENNSISVISSLSRNSN